jgi:DnaJ family protein C protein 19
MSTLALGLGLLGAGLGGRVVYQMFRGGARGADKWIKGGFKPKMDKPEAIQILALRCVA